jgi:hypothetical protein
VENRIWCELVKLHTVNIKKPTKEFVGRKRESAEKENEQHHPIAAWGLGIRSVIGKMMESLLETRPSALALSNSFCVRAEGAHLVAEFALPLVILFFFAKCFTHIHDLRSGARQENRRAQRLK